LTIANIRLSYKQAGSLNQERGREERMVSVTKKTIYILSLSLFSLIWIEAMRRVLLPG
jgi:hypothetical protein